MEDNPVGCQGGCQNSEREVRVCGVHAPLLRKVGRESLSVILGGLSVVPGADRQSSPCY